MIRLVFLVCASLLLLMSVPSAGPARPIGWATDTRVVQDKSGSGQHETAIAVNPHNADNAVVVFKDYRAAERNYLDATTDGGLTWREQPFAAVPGAPGNTDPAVFFRSDGRAYIVWTAEVEWPNAGLYCAWSDDGGFTWNAPVQITRVTGHYDDKPWLAFGSNTDPTDTTIYAAWTRDAPGELAGIDVAHSTNGGATWSKSVRVDAGSWMEDDDGAQWIVQPDGTLLLMFLHSNNAQSATLLLSRSTDDGATWSENRPIFNIAPLPYTLPGEHWRNFPYPSLVADPVRGWLSIVWADYSSAETNGADILLARSTDTGATWSKPLRLNDDPAGLVRDQWFPVLASAPDGRLTALWMDRRDDPTNRRYHAYARTSLDGGVNWQPSLRLSSASSDPNQNIPAGSDGIGDYIGLAAGPGVVWGAWVDVRNGNQDVYAARERFRYMKPRASTVQGPGICPPQSDTAPDLQAIVRCAIR
ncbi:MAG: glycoside hydrolase [Chloroflexota bacterium]|nr:glycoside hydrolase [Chloroflexota bacterium]